MRFFFGAMSPYSWFAAERIDDVLPGTIWSPVFAGGLFKAQGRVSWGLTDERTSKLSDCEARAAKHGLGPMRWPSPWPTSDLLVARAMLVARQSGVLERYALTAMRMAFLEARDLGDLASVLDAGERVGLDPAELGAAIEDPTIKALLRATTDEAVALGVRGIPTVAIDGQLFWGDDRLEDAAAAAGHLKR